jgi:two-component system response regulator PilR (NtrC family)
MTDTALKIHLVEDEEAILQEVAEYLRRRRLSVSTSANFESAQRTLTEIIDGLDVLVTDVRLPDGDGLDLVQQVAASSGRRPRVIVITGHLDQKSVTVARESGAEAVLLKPFALRTLLEQITSGQSAKPAA